MYIKPEDAAFIHRHWT